MAPLRETLRRLDEADKRNGSKLRRQDGRDVGECSIGLQFLRSATRERAHREDRCPASSAAAWATTVSSWRSAAGSQPRRWMSQPRLVDSPGSGWCRRGWWHLGIWASDVLQSAHTGSGSSPSSLTERLSMTAPRERRPGTRRTRSRARVEPGSLPSRWKRLQNGGTRLDLSSPVGVGCGPIVRRRSARPIEQNFARSSRATGHRERCVSRGC
jgi:hypothetical protein